MNLRGHILQTIRTSITITFSHKSSCYGCYYFYSFIFFLGSPFWPNEFTDRPWENRCRFNDSHLMPRWCWDIGISKDFIFYAMICLDRILYLHICDGWNVMHLKFMHCTIYKMDIAFEQPFCDRFHFIECCSVQKKSLSIFLFRFIREIGFFG